MVSLNGLASGLDINGIVTQLVAIERRSVNQVLARQVDAELRLDAYAAVRGNLDALRRATFGLTKPTDWLVLSGTSSNEAAVAVSAGTGSYGGSLTFTVDQLATAGAVRSQFTVASPQVGVAADDAILVAGGGRAYGIAAVASDDSLALGRHDIVVTQASAAATKLGDTALDASTTITAGVNDGLTVTVNGVARNLTIAAGTYTAGELAAAVQDAADAAGAAVAVTVDSGSGALRIATTREGSAATIQLGAGTANTALKLSADASALTGTDGKLKVGSGAETTLSSIEAGDTVALSPGTGTVTVTLAGGLRAGTLRTENVGVGDGSLAAVVEAVNRANVGVIATAVQVGASQYRLQLTGTSTGAHSGPNVADAEFAAGLGGLVTLTEGQDARITVGSGPGAYTIESASNVLRDVLPGGTLTLKQTTASPVTVSLGRDGEALADKVQSLVDAVNTALASIRTETKYDPDTKRDSALTGDSTVRRIAQSLVNAIINPVSTSAFASASRAGISLDREGAVTFDRAKFLAAFAENPDAVTALFAQGGTATDPQVRFVSAGARARPGTYAVAVTTAAAQAAGVGLEGSWPIGTPPLVKVRVGSTTVQYQVTAGDTQQDVVDALNAALTGAGLDVVAAVSGTGIELRTGGYGSAATFDVAWDGTTWETHHGTDVAGTINGVAATGTGRTLLAPFDDPEVGGLAVEVSGTTTGARGTVTYAPGVAQRLASAVRDANDFVDGALSSSEKATKTTIEFMQEQIASMERRVALFEARLRRQFADLETTLGALASQGTWLAGQIAGIASLRTPQR